MKESRVVNLLPNLHYASQDTLDPSPEENGFSDRSSALHWRDRCCGAVCVRIALRSLGLNAPTLGELIRIGVERGRYVAGVGWSHQGLADLLVEHHLEARAIAMNPQRLDSLLRDDWLAILSVRPLLMAQTDLSRRVGGHLVLCHGFSEDTNGRMIAYMISDPDYDLTPQRIANMVPAETVHASWTHRAIAVRAAG